MDGQRSLISDGGARPGITRRSGPGREAGATALGDTEDRTILLLTSAESILRSQ
jgi:hypothetical protein